LKNLKNKNAYLLGIIALMSMFIMQSCAKHINCPAYGKVNKSIEKTQEARV
jgi:Mrp family chromosome partitioning ATPase